MKLHRRPKILFVHDNDPEGPLSSFIEHDIDLLRKRFAVEVLSLYRYRHGHLDAVVSPAVWRSVASCDVVFAWFGWSAPIVIMGAVLHKRSVVVAGGMDVAYVPEIDYGLDPNRKAVYRLVLLGYRLARRVLLTSRSSLNDFVRLPSVNPANARVVYLGVDAEHFRPGAHKSPHVLSVSYISQSAIKRKGILTLLEAARRTPDIAYRIAGLVVDEAAVRQILDTAPPNVTFLGYLDHDRLLQELQSAKVYAQLSYHEGFGLAVAEAMSCACIPVVTDSGSLPEVVGDTGIYVPREDPDAATEAFRSAMTTDDTRGNRARKRIIDLFPPSARERALHAVIEEVCS